MKIGELLSVIEGFAPPALQEEYDNAGLITGNRAWECTGVLCTLDSTPAVVAEAIERGCNLIVAHHPILFKGLKKLNGSNYVEQVIIAAIKADVAIYAAHTNLDNVALGVSHTITSKLGLVDTSILQPKAKLIRRLVTFAPDANAEQVRNSLFKAGAGQIGHYSECSFSSTGNGTFKAGEGTTPFVGSIGERHLEKETKIEVVYPFYEEQRVLQALMESHPYEEVAYDIYVMENIHQGIGAGMIGRLPEPMDERLFLKMLKDRFGLQAVRHTPLLGKPVNTVAVCGGSGSFLIKIALSKGADVYISADIKYHEFFDAEGKMVVADIGHYESEQFAVDLLHDLLAKKFPTFAVLKTSVNTNPVQYFT